MWFSRTVLLLVAWSCRADVSRTEDTMKSSVSDFALQNGPIFVLGLEETCAVFMISSATQRITPVQRMVGGTLAPRVPWQVMVFLADNVLDGGYAGGALISDRWILTAGRNLFVRKSRQDIQGKEPVIPKVYLGISKRTEAKASSEVAVEKVVLHPGFQNKSNWDNDLALIQLKKAVVWPERDQDLANIVGGFGVIAGWGWGVLLTPAQLLKYLKVPLVNHNDCKAEYEQISSSPDVDDNMFCTKNTTYEENVCFGDAGGALAVTDTETGHFYAAGILSYDKACNRHKYGVYMKLSSYLPWIHSVMRGDTDKSAALSSDAMSKMDSWQP